MCRSDSSPGREETKDGRWSEAQVGPDASWSSEQSRHEEQARLQEPGPHTHPLPHSTGKLLLSRDPVSHPFRTHPAPFPTPPRPALRVFSLPSSLSHLKVGMHFKPNSVRPLLNPAPHPVPLLREGIGFALVQWGSWRRGTQGWPSYFSYHLHQLCDPLLPAHTLKEDQIHPSPGLPSGPTKELTAGTHCRRAQEGRKPGAFTGAPQSCLGLPELLCTHHPEQCSL